MKLSWRYHFVTFIVLLTYFILYSRYTIRTSPSFRNIPTDSRKKKFNYKVHKAMIKHRLKMFIANENTTDIKSKLPRKKQIRPTSNNNNYRLSRLLFQLWDPNNYQNQGNMLNCENLVSLDKKKYHQGRRFARKLNRKFYEYVNVSDIWDAIKDTCMSVRNVFKYKTPKYGADSFPIAYTITLDRTAEQSLRMLLSIYHHANIYCIHPNAKFGMLYVNVFRRLSECLPNIILPEKLYEIRVKTFHHLKAELGCFNKLLNSSVPWKYGINLPSSAFPLRNNSYIVQYLKTKPYENVISWSFPHSRFIRRIKYVHVVRETEGETLLMRTSTIKKPPPDNIVIFRKGNFLISTREFYHFLTESEIAKRLLAWAQDTKTPEDFYYSTLYRHKSAPAGFPYDPDDNLPEKMIQTLDNENVSDTPLNDLLVTLWKSDAAHHCHGQYRGHVCIFSAADLRWLIEQDNLFALSFDFRVDRVAIDCLAKNLQEPILPETGTDDNGFPPVTV